MNILIFSWRGIKNPLRGGAEIVTHEYAKGWIKNGHQVTLFTSTFENSKSEEIIDGVKIIRKGNYFLGVHIAAFFWYLFFRKESFDLIIDQFHGLPFFTPLYINKKKIAFIHETAQEVWMQNNLQFPLNLVVGYLGKMFEPLFFKFYKKIPFLTVSESSKKDLIDMGINKDKIRVIHNGVTLKPLNSKVKKESKKTLMYLGALALDKGIEDVLEVFSKVSKEGSDFEFWIVGKGEDQYIKKLKEKAKLLNIENKTTFWGFVSEEEKTKLLQKAHLLINLSTKEGWGLVVIEGASQGTPTVSYEVPGLKDSIINNQTGILIKQKNTLVVAQTILKLLNDKKKYSSMSEKAILWSKRFSWEKSIEESLKFFKEIT